jgi:biotin synthase
MPDWNTLADRVLADRPPSFDEALAVLASSDDDLLSLLQAAFRIRQRYHGRDVRIHVLQNAKSGLCPEDCGFCSQSVKFHTGVDRYPLQSVAELVAGARQAVGLGAVKYCMVTSTRGPSDRDLDVICEAVRQIKAELNINVCTSLGLLKEGQAERLAAAGVTRFNHNLESSRAHFREVCSTHTYDDRIRTGGPGGESPPASAIGAVSRQLDFLQRLPHHARAGRGGRPPNDRGRRLPGGGARPGGRAGRET